MQIAFSNNTIKNNERVFSLRSNTDDGQQIPHVIYLPDSNEVAGYGTSSFPQKYEKYISDIKSNSSVVREEEEASDISVRQTSQGAWEIAAIIDNQRVSRSYMGYDKDDAIAKFKDEMSLNEEMDTAVGTMDEFYEYVMDFYGDGGIYDFGATEEEVRQATDIVKNEVGDDFEGDSVDREKVRDVILGQMRSEEERKEAEKAFAPKDEVDYDKINDMMSNISDPIQTRADVDDDMDRMRNFNEADDIKKLAGLI